MSFTASNTATASPATQGIAQGAPAQIGGALGAGMAGMVGMIMMMSTMNSQGSSNPTGGSVSAGTPGGGGLPTDTSIPTLALSLSLTPSGLSAVAVFPPFARYRLLHQNRDKSKFKDFSSEKLTYILPDYMFHEG